MDLTHQLTPMLKSLRLSGILETLEVRNRGAIESSSRTSSSSPSSWRTRSSGARSTS
jgi:hypothetical protein